MAYYNIGFVAFIKRDGNWFENITSFISQSDRFGTFFS